MDKIKKGVIILLLVLSGLFCGCKQVIDNPADELMASSWKSEYENETKAELTFKDNSAQLTISRNLNNKPEKISGICIATDHDFIITDTATGKTLLMEYKLNGDSVELTYNSNTLVLNKAGVKIAPDR